MFYATSQDAHYAHISQRSSSQLLNLSKVLVKHFVVQQSGQTEHQGMVFCKAPLSPQLCMVQAQYDPAVRQRMAASGHQSHLKEAIC